MTYYLVSNFPMSFLCQLNTTEQLFEEAAQTCQYNLHRIVIHNQRWQT